MRLRIFLVEDSPVIRANLAESLEELVGARVVGGASTEDEARQWLTDHPTAWVILRQWRAPEAQGGGVEQLLLIAQCAREDLNSLCVQVIGRLIQQQQVGGHERECSQRHTCLLTT